MSEEVFNENVMEDFKREKFDYRQLLMAHLNRVSFLTTQIKAGEYSAQTFYFAVVSLEVFLIPYLDKAFYGKKEKLHKYYENGNEMEMEEAQRNLLPTWGHPSKNRGEPVHVRYGLALLSILQEVMARKGLLLEAEADTDTAKK